MFEQLLNMLNMKKEKSSSSVAKDRLKLVLVHDRSNCSGEILDKIRADIMEVISRYMDIDTEGLDIQLSQTKSSENDGNVPVLYANIPIKSIRKTETE